MAAETQPNGSSSDDIQGHPEQSSDVAATLAHTHPSQPNNVVTSDSSDRFPSIHDLIPRERGGEEARRGFRFQDHVAVSFYLEMLADDSLVIVWCEAADDITLEWRHADGTSTAEFVQVKSDELDQLWSMAKLCTREATGRRRRRPGTSIFEMSLGRDEYTEPSLFRVVVARPVNRALRPLTWPRNHVERQVDRPAYQKLTSTFPKHLRQVQSPKGNDYKYWLRHLILEVRHDEASLYRANHERLEQLLQRSGLILAPDQREIIYQRLLRRAADAAAARRIEERDVKRERQADLRARIRTTIEEARTRRPGSQSPLEWKLTAAGLSATTIAAAQETRLRYVRARRAARYFTSEEQDAQIEAEVGARLFELWTQLESGIINDSPRVFHERCLAALRDMRESLNPDRPPPLSMLQGIMYDRLHRCVLRLDRVAI